MILIFTVVTILLHSFVLESTKQNRIILHHIVCFGFFAPISNNDTESKIAKDKKNSRTTQMFTYTFFEEIQNNNVDGLRTF